MIACIKGFFSLYLEGQKRFDLDKIDGENISSFRKCGALVRLPLAHMFVVGDNHKRRRKAFVFGTSSKTPVMGITISSTAKRKNQRWDPNPTKDLLEGIPTIVPTLYAISS